MEGREKELERRKIPAVRLEEKDGKKNDEKGNGEKEVYRTYISTVPVLKRWARE
jgi:hypothetical protein